MNVAEHVLTEDVEFAKRLHGCSIYSLNRAKIALEMKCDYQEVNYWISEYQKCERELQELTEKKLHRDKLERQLKKVYEDMKTLGIDIQIEIVRRSLND
ncbi:hypothetical protein [Alkalihalobacterium alkalinitrilicum]|uniref:hypothetical protein n=1 Tax=Alkalihalobacterium alkalinitrilicum TaxID=427920 RepID=UPI0009957393|nr:hypothetical protein [Alkalihalobacterium alkalinitrilicum]